MRLVGMLNLECQTARKFWPVWGNWRDAGGNRRRALGRGPLKGPADRNTPLDEELPVVTPPLRA